MTSYSDFVDANAAMLDSKPNMLKTAQDIAMILDMPEMQLGSERQFEHSPLETRQRAFDLLCAVCANVDVPVPPLEKEMLRAIMNDGGRGRDKDAVRLAEQVAERDRSTLSNATILSRVAMMFPGVNGYSGINLEKIKAAINLEFLSFGIEPIRPDYSGITIDQSPKVQEGRRIKIVVVDDDINEAGRTMLSLVGIEGVDLRLYHYRKTAFFLSEEEKKRETERVAGEIAALNADIVLMDEGLPPIEGNQVTSALLKQSPDVIIVGNTGGDESKLVQAGASGNYDKGRSRNGCMTRAINAARSK